MWHSATCVYELCNVITTNLNWSAVYSNCQDAKVLIYLSFKFLITDYISNKIYTIKMNVKKIANVI